MSFSYVPIAVAHRARSPSAGRLAAVVRIWQTSNSRSRYQSLSTSQGGCLLHLLKLPIKELGKQDHR